MSKKFTSSKSYGKIPIVRDEPGFCNFHGPVWTGLTRYSLITCPACTRTVKVSVHRIDGKLVSAVNKHRVYPVGSDLICTICFKPLVGKPASRYGDLVCNDHHCVLRLQQSHPRRSWKRKELKEGWDPDDMDRKVPDHLKKARIV